MGLYINMEMPKSCPICIVIDTVGQARRYDLNNDRYTDDKLFEAVPVPTPHGRCIDADALCNRLEKAGKIKPYLESGLNLAISFALTAPTIIPANEDK